MTTAPLLDPRSDPRFDHSRRRLLGAALSAAALTPTATLSFAAGARPGDLGGEQPRPRHR